MKNKTLIFTLSICFSLTIFVVACSTPTTDEAAQTEESTASAATETPAAPDMAALKAEIQTLESGWAAADNARDLNSILAYYSDDAQSLSNNEPLIVGKDGIKKNYEKSMAKREKGSTVAYDIMNVYGNENTVTETGKTTRKDASGKVTYTGKYMAVWEKRDGKYICVADISNDDVKEK